MLRFNHADERTLDGVQAEVEILNCLIEKGVPVSKPVLSEAGRFVEEVETEPGTNYAVVFEVLPGKHWEFEELTLEQFTSWGQELGRLHQALKEMPDSYRHNRPTYKEQLASLEHPEAQELLQWMETQQAGLIHYDFELDNIRWDGEQAGLLDFDDCAVYPYQADIAFALRDLFENGVDARDSRWQNGCMKKDLRS